MNKQRHLFQVATPYDRASFLVQSESNDGTTYLVDLEGCDADPVVCTCDHFCMTHEPCKHIRSVIIQTTDHHYELLKH
jgi:hypothetical protein